MMDEYSIKNGLETGIISREVYCFETIDSTNSYAAKIADKVEDGCVIISEEQTQGRGRTGKTWFSKKGEGLYLTFILKPKIDIARASFLTQVTGATLVKTLEEFSVLSFIKWPNDIILNGKKLAGILTEMSVKNNGINHILVGVGINLLQKEFDKDISELATSLYKEGKTLDKVEFLQAFFRNFENYYLKFLQGDIDEVLRILRDKSAIIGREVFLVNNDKKEKVFVKDVDKDGGLIVLDKDNLEKRIFTGEVSIRGLKSYI